MALHERVLLATDLSARSDRALDRAIMRLVRAVDVPLLIVTDRPRARYQRVGVAADFSTVSRQSLELALHLFPEQAITVFHAYQPLAMYGASDTSSHHAQFREMADSDFSAWLAAANVTPEMRRRVRPKLELGDPVKALRAAVEEGAFDLVVIGTKGRGRLFEFFIGSTAKRLLAELPCDALFIRESQLAGATPAPAE